MLDGIDPVNISELIDASREGNAERVKELLENETIKNNAHAEFNDALHIAVEGGHTAVVIQLLEISGVRAHANVLHNYALRIAAEKGHTDVVKQLLKIPEVRGNADVWHNSALQWAVSGGHTDVVEQLLSVESVRREFKENTTPAQQEQIVQDILNGLIEKNPITMIDGVNCFTREPTLNESNTVRWVNGLLPASGLMLSAEQRDVIDYYLLGSATRMTLMPMLLDSIDEKQLLPAASSAMYTPAANNIPTARSKRTTRLEGDSEDGTEEPTAKRAAGSNKKCCILQ